MQTKIPSARQSQNLTSLITMSSRVLREIFYYIISWLYILLLSKLSLILCTFVNPIYICIWFWTFRSCHGFWFPVLWQLTTSLLRIIKCPIMSDQNMGWSQTHSVRPSFQNYIELCIKPSLDLLFLLFFNIQRFFTWKDWDLGDLGAILTKC
jgi:hypothetical protein